MNIYDLIDNPPKLHKWDGEATSSWKLADVELLYLSEQVSEGMKTIETGAGMSTIVFAMKETEHICIVPDEEEVNRIKSFCAQFNVSLSKVRFCIGNSEYVLPKIDEKDFHLALIDGRHAFPTPFIDWFYMANLLHDGGILIIDDLHIWTCELLMNFLLAEKGWELIQETLSAATFIKHDNSSQNKEYMDQLFVLNQSRQVSLNAKVRYLTNLLKRRKFSLFRDTVILGFKSLTHGEFGKRQKR